MIVSLILAMDEEGGIGKKGQVPWHLRTDLQRFKQITLGHHLIMGRKTYESIGKPLSGRTNIIISRNKQFEATGCLVVHSFLEALDLAAQSGENEVFVIGGGDIFAQALPAADRLYLTCVQTRAGCDVFFTGFNWNEWVEVKKTEHPVGDRDSFASTFYLLERSSAR